MRSSSLSTSTAMQNGWCAGGIVSGEALMPWRLGAGFRAVRSAPCQWACPSRCAARAQVAAAADSPTRAFKMPSIPGAHRTRSVRIRCSCIQSPCCRWLCPLASSTRPRNEGECLPAGLDAFDLFGAAPEAADVPLRVQPLASCDDLSLLVRARRQQHSKLSGVGRNQVEPDMSWDGED